ncbi:hypothetical protein GCM10009841_13620 [Microlunatus panaciterrae]|uniref:Glycerophosphoryl diester phosphodiesterase n=1 Tax=Microlunatus panaciterrae TaxID=400768 RepID=A0ABS2RLR0_9ACTN|nr:glycerophosphodiester phosphodiesterase family protein [Microlunatus panaciterrae]MBM7799922.1 glycerophosphoryl diester phosphodiesterase [Microlunatus panaciterrae]
MIMVATMIGAPGTVPVLGPALAFSQTAQAATRHYPRFGQRSRKVMVLQSRLVKAKVLRPRYRTGYFGPRTRAAVKRFQRLHGLAATGKIDSRTWRVLMRRTRPVWKAPAAIPSSGRRILMIAGHRGTNKGAPESTLAAFRRAARSADILEFDVQWSEDGVAVVIHDTTLDRTTDCSGPVAERTLRQLRRCDAGRGERIPTFAEVLRLAKSLGRPVNPEAKGHPTAAQIRDYVRKVRHAGMLSRTTVASTYSATLRQFAAVEPRLRRALISYHRGYRLRTIRNAKATVYISLLQRLTKDKVVRLHRAQVEVWPYNGVSKSDFDRAREVDADCVMVDDPALFRSWMS